MQGNHPAKIDIKWSCFGIRLDLVDEQILALMENPVAI